MAAQSHSACQHELVITQKWAILPKTLGLRADNGASRGVLRVRVIAARGRRASRQEAVFHGFSEQKALHSTRHLSWPLQGEIV